MNDKVIEYLEINKEITELKRQQSELRKRFKELEEHIKEYMERNDLPSIESSNGTVIFLSDKKIPQTFKKDIVVNKLTEKLTKSKLNDTSIEDLADSILKNDVFLLEKTIKLKKK